MENMRLKYNKNPYDEIQARLYLKPEIIYNPELVKIISYDLFDEKEKKEYKDMMEKIYAILESAITDLLQEKIEIAKGMIGTEEFQPIQKVQKFVTNSLSLSH